MPDTFAIFANRRAHRTWLQRVLEGDGGMAPAADPNVASVAVADLDDGLEAVLTSMADHPMVPFVICHEGDHHEQCRLAVGAGAAECVRLDAGGTHLRRAAERAARTGHQEPSLLISRLALMERIFATTADRTLDPPAQIAEVLRLGCRLFDAETAAVARISDGRYRVAHAHDRRDRIRPGAELPVGETFCEITLAANRTIGIADVRQSRWRTHPAAGSGLRSYIGVPVRVEERSFGTLSFSSERARPTPLSDRDLEFAATLGDWVGSLLTRERRMRELEALVTHDRLTGLPNREAILHRLERSVRRAERTPDYGFALLFVDLEGFREVTDTIGQHAGDTLLRQVGRRIRDVIRPKDGVGRFAGEEFVVLLEDTDLVQARGAADRIVAALGRPFHIADRTIVVGARVGVAMGTTADSARDLVIAADEAMYTAKSTGRPVVTVTTGSTSPSD